MKRKFLLLIAILFPWLILLSNDNPVGAFMAIIMQVTVVGWIPASAWAIRVLNGDSPKKKKNADDNFENLD